MVRSVKEQRQSIRIKETRQQKLQQKQHEDEVESLVVEKETHSTQQPTTTDKKDEDKAVTFDSNKKDKFIQKWLNQISAKGVTVILFIFTLLAILRGKKDRLSIAIQHSINKLWHSIKLRKYIYF